MMASGDENRAVTNFCEYLRIKTVHPKPDYNAAVKFLSKIGQELDLNISTIKITDDHPILVMTWLGSEPRQPSLLLSSHMDVVPVFEEHWKVDPFSAEKMENGDIYARGSQDMKSVGIQYLEAVRKLKSTGYRPTRTIHTLFTTDEEIGSFNGMQKFVKTQEFRDLNVGCVLDEGLASPTSQFVVYNCQKLPCGVVVKCKGNPGHGSQLIENTAGEKVRVVIDRLLDLRSSEKAKLDDPSVKFRDIIVVNLTKLEGGVQNNVLPSELTAGFDMRVPPTYTQAKVDAIMTDVSAGLTDVSWTFVRKISPSVPSSVDANDPWWKAFSAGCDNMKLDYRVDTFPAGTDSHFMRELGIPAYGFSPMNNTPILLHDHNEFLNEAVFLRGIDIYVSIITSMAK